MRTTKTEREREKTNPPQGASLATSTISPVRQDCRCTSQGFLSWTSSLAQTGLLVSLHTGQMHTASPSTFLQPRLNGASQPFDLQGSAKYNSNQTTLCQATANGTIKDHSRINASSFLWPLPESSLQVSISAAICSPVSATS